MAGMERGESVTAGYLRKDGEELSPSSSMTRGNFRGQCDPNGPAERSPVKGGLPLLPATSVVARLAMGHEWRRGAVGPTAGAYSCFMFFVKLLLVDLVKQRLRGL
jgi:hypothetical protein